HPPNSYSSTRLAYDESIANHGPDDFYTLKKAVEHHFDDFTLQQLLSYLRLSGWDSKIFLDSYPALQLKLASVPDNLRAELYDATRQLWATHYPIGEQRNLAGYLGSLLYEIEYYPKALEYFHHALDQVGPDPAMLTKMALCHYHLRQLKPALKRLNQALDLDPTHEQARTLRTKIQTKLKRRKS
ncbi:MAG: tetratricopeptide repeat protein, partial [Cyanobacteria bacterium P01_D01_bin.44]